MDGLSDETRAVLQQAMKALNFGEKSRPVANGTPDPPRLLKPPSVGAGQVKILMRKFSSWMIWYLLPNRWPDFDCDPPQRGSGSGGYWPGAARPESKVRSIPTELRNWLWGCSMWSGPNVSLGRDLDAPSL
jgi:hypothetical protein